MNICKQIAMIAKIIANNKKEAHPSMLEPLRLADMLVFDAT